MTKKQIEKFAFSYFDQNPISQVGLVLTKSKKAEKICDLVGNPKKFNDKVQTLRDKYMCQGEPSIQNSLELCLSSLK
jgi:transcription initiation factor TFIIH subunit 2